MTFQEALQKLLREVDELVPQEAFSRAALDRFYTLRSKLHRPIDTFLSSSDKYAPARKLIGDLVESVGEYIIRFKADPAHREARRKRVEELRARIQAELGGAPPHAPQEAPDNAHVVHPSASWDVVRESPGRLTVRAPSGAVSHGVPSLGMLRSALHAATEAQGRYPPRARPHDKQGRPGGLVTVDRANRLIVIGDLRGKYGHFVRIADQTGILEDLAGGKTHLLFTGNAFHPSAGRSASTSDFQRAATLMTAVCALKARYPVHVHTLRGNFDHAHAGGITGGPASRLDQTFRDGMSKAFNGGIVLDYQKFVETGPVAARFGVSPEAILIVHATVPYGLDSEDRLVAALMAGPRSKLLEDILWSRRYDAVALQNVRSALDIRFVISGYAPFPGESAERTGLTQVSDSPFAHREEMQMVVSSHGPTFGYLDIDLSRTMPDSVLRLRAPDGRWAMRVIAGGSG